MDDFRLKVFVSAARSLSFSKCARMMNISQPAVSKHINELENGFGTVLFERNPAGVTLTGAGRTLLEHAESILAAYRKMEFEMGLVAGTDKGRLAIGASTTIAKYLMPEILARFMKRFEGIEVSMFSGNSSQVEESLRDGRTDIGFVENASRSTGLQYRHLCDDELVIVTGSKSRYSGTGSIGLDRLCRYPLAMREKGSGTREIIERAMQEQGADISALNIMIELNSTEAIKSFIKNCDCLAVVSVISIRDGLSDGSLTIIDTEGPDLTREFAAVVRPGEYSGLNGKFFDFARHCIGAV